MIKEVSYSTFQPSEVQLSESSKFSGKLYGYDVGIDVHDFTNPTENITALKLRKKHDLETMLGERFNVEIAISNYNLNNGRLQHSEFDEPFADRIARGVQFRKERNSPDQEREQAELVGFLYLEQQIENAPIGTKLVVISPPGKEYKHNFFDVYEKTGPLEVTTSRYTSSLSQEEQFDLAQRLDASWRAAALINPNIVPTDADFLRHPITTQLSKENLLALIHPKKDTMPLSDFEDLKTAAAPLIRAYVNQLEKNPNSAYPLYRALLNFADQYVFDPQSRDLMKKGLNEQFESTVDDLADMPVRPVMAGCGLQGNPDSLSNNSPYSAADFGMQDRFGRLDIECKQCGRSYLRTPGVLEEKCRKCGGTKGIAC